MNDDSFYSVNRLVEFGMSLAVAQQMAKSMNIAIDNMQVPGSMNSFQQTQQQFYFVIIEEKQAGPFSEQELSRLISEGTINKETFIWKPGLQNWVIAEKLPEVLKLVVLTPPPFHQNI